MLEKLLSKPNSTPMYFVDKLEQIVQENIDPSQYLLSESCSTPQGHNQATDEEFKNDLIESKILRKQ